METKMMTQRFIPLIFYWEVFYYFAFLVIQVTKEWPFICEEVVTQAVSIFKCGVFNKRC